MICNICTKCDRTESCYKYQSIHRYASAGRKEWVGMPMILECAMFESEEIGENPDTRIKDGI